MASHSANFLFLLFSLLAMNTFAEMFPSAVDPFASTAPNAAPESKIMIRSKRQQCICVAVMFQDSENLQNLTPASNYQCACDPTPTSAGAYTSPLRQQQDLQRELQMARGIANQCGCQLIAARLTTTVAPMLNGNNNGGQPLYDCQCYGTGNQQNMPPATTTTTTTTTTQAPTTTTTATSKPQSVIVPLRIQPPGQSVCQCFEIEIELTQQRQFQCDCGNGVTYLAAPGLLPTTSSTTTTAPPPTTTSITTTTTTAPTTTFLTTVPPMFATTKDAPDAMPCVMVRIQTGEQACACQENYRQCTENVCCNVQKFRSLKTVSPTPSTVDLLVDFLHKVRQSFTS